MNPANLVSPYMKARRKIFCRSDEAEIWKVAENHTARRRSSAMHLLGLSN